MALRMKMKLLWDPKLVLTDEERRGARALKGLGGWIRTGVQRSIKKGEEGEISKPGSPPQDQKGFLKNQIFFAYSYERQSVIVGPQKISRRSKNAPRALEMGGRSTTSEGEEIIVKKRPYMGPIFRKSIQKEILLNNLKQ